MWVHGRGFLPVPVAVRQRFTRDPKTFAIGGPSLRVFAFAMLPTGLEIATAESVLGSGHTAAISWIFSLFSLVRIPLAFVIPRWTHGPIGIAWLISVTCILRAACILAWVSRGTWKRGLAGELGTR